MGFRSVIATCVLFFFIGFLMAPDSDYDSKETSENNGPAIDLMMINTVLKRQANAHQTFQKRIHDLQFPIERHNGDDASTRKLIVKASPRAIGANPFEQFAREFHYLALSLQVAVTTNRTMVLEDDWKLLPDIITPELLSDNKKNNNINNINNCEPTRDGVSKNEGLYSRSVACLRQAINSGYDGVSNSKTEASLPQKRQPRKTAQSILDVSSMAFGIIPGLDVDDRQNALLFHAQYYGQEAIVEMPSWPYPKSTYLIDIVPQLERSWGRFWVRSQMVHFIWEQWQDTKATRAPSSPSPFPPTASSPYLAMYWISSEKMRKNLAVKYGRNATITQSIDAYMNIANRIRKGHEDPTTLDRIFLITDGANEVPQPDLKILKFRWPDWTFVIPSVSETENDDEATLASLKIMREATYLIGSFQSQMFRLGAELNAAWYAAQYPFANRRHWTVDVEWFENP